MFTYLESSLLIFTKGILTNELHNFDEIVLLLEDLLDTLLESHEFWVTSVVVLGEGSIVVGVRDVPVDRWEMLSLGELFI
mgnify:CR=1 FL=1